MGGMLRWSEDQLRDHLARKGGGHPPEAVPAPRGGARKVTQPPTTPVVAPAAPAASAMDRLRAKGRKKAGEMNTTEKAYAELLEGERHAGRILWWAFEAITLKLAKDCRLTVDFAVMTPEGRLELHDVKGCEAVWQDDAKVKMKVAADKFPRIAFRACWPNPKKAGGGWTIKEIG